MRERIVESIMVPEGIECSIEESTLRCRKGEKEISKDLSIPGIKPGISGSEISLTCIKGNKKDRARIMTFIKHINNMFKGLQEEFVYELEICHVHFPMTTKIEGNEFIISNFLGEKHKRKAKIVEGVKVDVKGNKINVSSTSIEAAGQTAANIEKSTKVPKKDRRIFQDGIFITSKPGGAL
jgi:large subunit ribosomal protein L6